VRRGVKAHGGDELVEKLACDSAIGVLQPRDCMNNCRSFGGGE
jgi:hypothetical protein